MYEEVKAMSVNLERILQNKVLHWLIDKEEDGGLGYTYPEI